MNKQFNLILVIDLALMAFTSCNSYEQNDVIPDSSVVLDSTPYGEIIGDTFVPSEDAPLYPLVKGLEWCYGGDFEFCTRMTDRTKVINDQVFIISESEENGHVTESFSRVDEQGRLHSIVEYPFKNEYGEVVFTNNLDLEWFLESDPLGAEREFIAMNNRYTTNKHIFTLQDKDLTLTVNHVKYKNVMKISQVVFTNFNYRDEGSSQSVETIGQDIYIAKGIGNIKVVTTSELGVGSSNIFLLSFTAVQ